MPAVTDPAIVAELPDLIRLQGDARALRLPSSRPLRASQSGPKPARRRGRGMLFSEVRQYQPGDDLRSIDWRVTARRQQVHTKLYEEERERPLLLICDLGPSMFFASTGAYKQVRCAQYGTLLAWLRLWAGDRVGGIVFNGHEQLVQQPARRRKSVLQLLDTLARLQWRPGQSPIPVTKTTAGLDMALAEACRVVLTGSHIFVLSDFLNAGSETTRLLGALARHSRVTALRIIDPLERQLPENGHFAVASSGGPLWFDAGNQRFRQAWAARVRQHEATLAACFHSAGIAAAVLLTGEQPVQALQPLLGPGGKTG